MSDGATTPPPLNAASATAVFEDLRTACEADGGELWGVSLYGPMLLADPSADVLVANQPAGTVHLEEDGGVFVGSIPEDLMLANTAVDWDGVRWSMVLWPVPSESEAHLTLLVHEAWHRVQADLGIPAAGVIASHLDEMDARINLRMELSSLVDALKAQSIEEAGAHAARALSYRLERRASYPDGVRTEDELEMSEGLAEYTGRKLGHAAPELAVAAAVAGAAPATFVRSFAYFTGPAYGLLLDRLTPEWRARVLKGATLSELAAEALLATDPAEPDVGLREEIEATERQRDEDRARRNRRWVELLVSGPTLRLPISSLQTVFDPGALVALTGHGTVYPSVKLTDRWGHVDVIDWGALIDADWQWISLSAQGIEMEASHVTGRGWELELNAGWAIEVAGTGHQAVEVPSPS